MLSLKKMIKEIVCTRVKDKVSLDIWPFDEVGDKIMCPRQIPGTKFFCTGCVPGYPSVVVKEVDEKHILLDPIGIPEWINSDKV